MRSPVSLRESICVCGDKRRGDRVWELGGDTEEFGDEGGLCDGISLCYPPRSALPNHFYRFNSLQCPPRGRARSVAFRQPGPLLDRAMVLFHHIIEVFALTQKDATRQDAFRFQGFHRRWKGRVLVHVDDSRHGIARRAQSLTEEAFSSGSISLGGEQKLDRLTGRVHRTVEIFVLTFNLYIGLVGT